MNGDRGGDEWSCAPTGNLSILEIALLGNMTEVV